MARVLPVGNVERRPHSERRTNVGEIAQVEHVARGAPQHDGDHLKDDPQQRGNLVFCQAVHPRAFPRVNLCCHYARARLQRGTRAGNSACKGFAERKAAPYASRPPAEYLNL